MTALMDLDAIAAATCQVEYWRIGSTQKWRLSGPEAAVREKVASLQRRYPKEAYGTTVDYQNDGSALVRAFSAD